MKIRIKKRGLLSVKRIGLDGKIGKIELMEKPMEGKGKGLSVIIKGLEGIGAVIFSDKEIEMLREKIVDKARKKKK